MKKIKLKKLDVSIYRETLENGLDVVIAPRANMNTCYATFTIKFGSNVMEFVPIDEKKHIKVPAGIAHFLEHQLFEQENGIDPFTFFGQRGADANANTSQYKTTYLFSGIDAIEENVGYLLDFVQAPHFTDDSVEKEKGIIEQEIGMYKDMPFDVLYEKSLYHSFVNDPMKISIIGSVKSIYSITKEQLYQTYHTFYHPSNMVLIVVGNVDPKAMIEFVRNNQSQKQFDKQPKPKIKSYEEPDEVASKEERFLMDVSVPKLAVNVKLNISEYHHMNPFLLHNYINLYFDLKFGATSKFVESLKKQEIITDSLYITYLQTKDHLLFMIMSDTKKPQELKHAILAELKNKDFSSTDFIRKQKVYKSTLTYITENVYNINHKIMNNIIKYGDIIDNDIALVEQMNEEQLKDIITSLDFSNHCTITIEKK